MNQQQDSAGGGLGKAIGIVFMLFWTLGSAGMSIAFLGFGSSGTGGFGGAPRFMAIVPIGFTIIGVLMLVKIATAKPVGAAPICPASSQPPSIPPSPRAPIPCPGCGSRKNPPGSTVCVHCGGTISPV